MSSQPSRSLLRMAAGARRITFFFLLSTSLAALPAAAAGGKWVAQGPGPISPAQVENIAPGNEAVGAIHTVIAHPSNPDVLYVGGVNGGVWRTANATAIQPSWERLTDDMPSQSIGALSFDPTDASNRAIWAGIGRFSSFGRAGGNRTGLLKTTNRGNRWQVVDGGGTLVGKNISGVAARGSTIAVSVNTADAFTFANIGIWRSTDGGASFTQIASGNGAATGLPGGVTDDLVGDPNNPARLFTSVRFANLVGGQNGVYRSDDTGATWTKVSNPAMDALIISGITSNTEFAVGNHDNVYAAIANSGRLAGLFRSGNGGNTWTTLDLPGTIEDGGFFFGIHPGGQAGIHLSLAADPSNPNLLYIAGDRQPLFNEASGNPVPGFPNSIGARNFTGRLFRVDASQAPGSQSSHLTHSNTASNSAPHADSREMAFDASGRLVETNDGGVYARVTPGLNTGDWISLNGDIQTTESHDSVYDTLSNIVFAGNQDNGTPMQNLPDDLTWGLFVGGDGGDVQVDPVSVPGFSIRYTSAQVLQVFNRSFWDPTNTFNSFQFVGLNVLGGGNAVQGQFSTPVELNGVNPARLLIAGGNSLYESLDMGDTVREVGPGLVVNGTFSQPLAYGATGNAEVIYAGAGDALFVRTAAQPALVSQAASFPGTGSGFSVRDIVVDPRDANHAFVINSVSVFETTDAGATWSDITGDVVTKAGAATPFRSIEFLADQSDDDDGDDDGDDGFDVLAVGATNGAFFSKDSRGFAKWKSLGSKLPVVPVFDLDYDASDDVLIAGTLGRGNWKLRPFADDDDDDDDG